MKKKSNKRRKSSHNTGRPYQQLVAYVVKAMDPGPIVEEGKWIDGPDGKRDLDVVVKGTLNGKEFSILIECKDYDKNKTGPVGINFVDAIDSKRHDIPVDTAMICSNSGFTAPAIRKAKRKQIGLISILKEGDPKVKVEILEEIYIRHVTPETISVDFGISVPKEVPLNEILFHGSPIINWIYNRLLLIIGWNYKGSGQILDTLRLKKPIPLVFGDGKILSPKLDITFSYKVKWFSQIITIDASLGMYDYLTGNIRLARDREVQYFMKGVDLYGGESIDFIPERDSSNAGLQPGELQMDLVMWEGIKFSHTQKDTPDLDPYIVEKDLDWRILD